MRNFKFVALVLFLGLVAVLGYRLDITINGTPRPRPAKVLDHPVRMVASAMSQERRGPEVKRDSWEAIARKFVPKESIPDVSYLLHHIANWNGFPYPTGSFTDLDQRTLMSILIDGAKHPAYKPEVPLLFVDFLGRPDLAYVGAAGVESHPQQVLATLGMLGLPSSTSLRSEGTTANIANLILRAQDHLVLEGEIEWTAMALALYSPTSDVFTNQWEQEFSFELIAKRLLDRQLNEGACVGTHTLQALAVLLQVDAQISIFDQQTELLILNRLRDVLGCLKKSQSRSGYWTPEWPYSLADESTQRLDNLIFPDLLLVQATGHHLEWIELLPDSIEVDEAMLIRAKSWCLQALEKVEKISDERLCPYSHCFRAVRKHLTLCTPSK